MLPAESVSAFAAARRLHQWVRQGKSFSGGERNNCFLNLGHSRFADISGSSGFDAPDDARAIGLTDWDLDGDWDLWVANRNGPQLRFFENNSQQDGKSLMLSLVGTKCNRDAIGARVVGVIIPKNGGSREPAQLIRTVRAGDGYLSQSSKLIHFGLGDVASALHVVVRWPSGDEQDFGLLQPGRYRLIQGEEIPKVLSPQALSRNASDQSMSVDGGRRGEHRADGFGAFDAGRVVLASRMPIPSLTYATSTANAEALVLRSGQPTLIHLWAPWCAPCLQELNEHIQHAADLRAVNLRMVLLTVPGPGAERVLNDLKNPFEARRATDASLDILQVVNNHIFDRHRPLPVPTSFLFDGKGELAIIYKGPVTVKRLLADTQSLEQELANRRLASVPFPGRWIGTLGQLRLGPLAVALAEAGRLETAMQYVRTHGDRFQPETLARLFARAGNELYNQGEFTAAVTRYREAIDVDPEFAPAHLNLAVALLRNRDRRGAATELARAIQLAPNYAPAHFQYGMLLLQMGQPDQALQHLMAAVQHRPRETQYRLTFANVLLRAGKMGEAIAELQSALRYQPSDTAALGMLGTAYVQLGQDARAAECFGQIVQQQPDLASAHGDLARILATTEDTQLRDVPRAIRLAEHACQLENRQNPRRLVILALAYRAAEREVDAERTLRIALKLAEKTEDPGLVAKIRGLLK